MVGICTACGQVAVVRKVDNGIGWTEFWGAMSKDVDYAVETQCCDAPAIDEDGNPITLSDLAAEYEG